MATGLSLISNAFSHDSVAVGPRAAAGRRPAHAGAAHGAVAYGRGWLPRFAHATNDWGSVSQRRTSRRISPEPPPSFNSGRDIPPFRSGCSPRETLNSESDSLKWISANIDAVSMPTFAASSLTRWILSPSAGGIPDGLFGSRAAHYRLRAADPQQLVVMSCVRQTLARCPNGDSAVPSDADKAREHLDVRQDLMPPATSIAKHSRSTSLLYSPNEE